MSRIGITSLLAAALMAFSAGAADQPAPKRGGAKADQPRDDRRSEDPADRQGRKEWKDRADKLTPEEREEKRKELRARLDKRLTVLRARQTNATLSPAEEKELQRCEQLRKRFDQGKKGDKPRPPAADPR